MALSDRPRTNVSQHLADNFKLEQERFLQAQASFKAGYLFYGPVAVSLLTSMFYILPAGRIIAKDAEEKTGKAKEFVDLMDSFRLEAYQFGKRKGIDNLLPTIQLPLTQDFIELDNKYDALVREFYLIMFMTGFSP
jgi:hypothetical protein